LPSPSAWPDPKSTRTVSLMVAICHRMKQYRHITTAMRFAEGLLKRTEAKPGKGRRCCLSYDRGWWSPAHLPLDWKSSRACADVGTASPR
jgi:hypothetical protein